MGTGMRVPIVAGVGGGVGTTTVAVGLRGHDGGRVAGHRPDILVCRGTLDSVRRAADVLGGADPAPPVLAVTLAGRAARGTLRAELELLEPDLAGLVLLPHVRRWSALADPLVEAARLLVEPAGRLPRPLRTYAAALRELVDAVAASGRLGGDAEPAGTGRPFGRDRSSDERHIGRLGSYERAVRRESGAARAAGPPGPPTPPPPPPPPPPHRAVAAGAIPASWIHDERPGRRTGPAERPLRPHGDAAPRRGVRIVVPDPVRPGGAQPPGAPGAAVGARRIEQVG